MRNKFEDEFKATMNTLRFSPEDKERIAKNIIEYQNPKEKREEIKMNKWTLPKAAAVAAACLLVTGGTVFAASKIVMYTASSNGSYDYTSIAEINDAALDIANSSDAGTLKLPEVLGNFTISGGNTVTVSGKDDSENTVGKWDDLYAEYKNADDLMVSLSLSAHVTDDETRTPTETRTINGITASYNRDEYLVLPNEDEPLSPNVQEREKTDDHFFVSYGSSEAETIFYSGVSFVKDGVSYNLFTSNDISADELFDLAEELIGR